jgi:hypothetical protein
MQLCLIQDSVLPHSQQINMKNKSYVESQLNVVEETVTNLANDLDNNRPYVTKEYLMDRLDTLKKRIILVQERIQLEDENS